MSRSINGRCVIKCIIPGIEANGRDGEKQPADGREILRQLCQFHMRDLYHFLLDLRKLGKGANGA